MNKLEAAKAAYLHYMTNHDDDIDFLLVYILPLNQEDQVAFFHEFPNFPRIVGDYPEMEEEK